MWPASGLQGLVLCDSVPIVTVRNLVVIFDHITLNVSTCWRDVLCKESRRPCIVSMSTHHHPLRSDSSQHTMCVISVYFRIRLNCQARWSYREILSPFYWCLKITSNPRGVLVLFYSRSGGEPRRNSTASSSRKFSTTIGLSRFTLLSVSDVLVSWSATDPSQLLMPSNKGIFCWDGIRCLCWLLASIGGSERVKTSSKSLTFTLVMLRFVASGLEYMVTCTWLHWKGLMLR